MTESHRIESAPAGQASVVQQPRRTSRAFGLVSLGLSTLAAIGLAKARASAFVHGEELFAAIAYLIPLVLSGAALIFAIAHAVRRRFAGLFAWLPAVLALPMVGWLVGFIFFDAFRNP